VKLSEDLSGTLLREREMEDCGSRGDAEIGAAGQRSAGHRFSCLRLNLEEVCAVVRS
jgi:hypothetical protein